MFNRKSIYTLNKKDPNAIVYTDADGNLIRLTRNDFASEDEFLDWKELSDADYHGEEKRDHRHADYVISLEGLSEEAIAVPSVEEDSKASVSEGLSRSSIVFTRRRRPLLSAAAISLLQTLRLRNWSQMRRSA